MTKADNFANAMAAYEKLRLERPIFTFEKALNAHASMDDQGNLIHPGGFCVKKDKVPEFINWLDEHWGK